MELGEPVLKQSWEDSIKGRAEVHKHDSGICSWGVQMLEAVVQSHVYYIVHRFVGSVGKLQWVQRWVGEGFEVGQYKALKRLHAHKGQCNGSVVIQSCHPWLLGDGADGEDFEAGWHMTGLQ